MLDEINGMFAFALWDKRKEKLLIARDRFGEKPLYYGAFDGKLIFASELKVLLEHPSVEAEINLDALRQFLSFDYVPAPASIYKNIYKLPAAHFLTVENGEVKTRRYWNLTWHKNGNVRSLEKAAEDLRELLADAVRMRLVSDVPLGILLSGGVDSSTVAAFAAQFSSASPIGGLAIPNSAASLAGEPDWAKRFKRSQSVAHGVSLAAHSVRAGDAHGAGTSINLSEGR